MKMRVRGLVWLFVGLVLWLGGILIMDRPLVLRGTNVPFGPIVMGMGALLLVWDFVQHRRARTEEPPP
jgi:hypothetical protein